MFHLPTQHKFLNAHLTRMRPQPSRRLKHINNENLWSDIKSRRTLHHLLPARINGLVGRRQSVGNAMAVNTNPIGPLCSHPHDFDARRGVVRAKKPMGRTRQPCPRFPRMILRICDFVQPPPKPSSVSHKPSSWKQPVSHSVPAIESAAATSGDHRLAAAS